MTIKNIFCLNGVNSLVLSFMSNPVLLSGLTFRKLGRQQDGINFPNFLVWCHSSFSAFSKGDEPNNFPSHSKTFETSKKKHTLYFIQLERKRKKTCHKEGRLSTLVYIVLWCIAFLGSQSASDPFQSLFSLDICWSFTLSSALIPVCFSVVPCVSFYRE